MFVWGLGARDRVVVVVVLRKKEKDFFSLRPVLDCVDFPMMSVGKCRLVSFVSMIVSWVNIRRLGTDNYNYVLISRPCCRRPSNRKFQ